jgi:hypothetical protein
MKRCCIVGTAPSWVRTPWSDPSLEIWGINDGYMSRDGQGRPMPRADRWFDIHPLDKMYFRDPKQRIVRAEDVPPGFFIRPKGHIEWLQAQAKTIPVFLQAEPPEGWPVNAKRFPLEEVEAAFGQYWASGPSYMVALAILEGYQEIHIYGIHLSTQQEYLEQRANFEHLLGIARGRGITVVMAEESPVLRHPWKYGYEPRPMPTPDPARQALKQELKAAQQRKAELVQALVTWPRFKSKEAALEELRRVQVIEMDAQQQLARTRVPGALVAA